MRNKRLKEKTVKFRFNVVATIRDAESGKILRVEKWHNIIPTVARTAIASYLGNVTGTPATLYPNKCAVGTGTNAPTNSDTQLQTETYRNNVASRTNSANVAYITGFFTAVEVTGTFREAALFIDGGAGANSGTLFSRVAINITKAVTETLTLDWTITVV